MAMVRPLIACAAILTCLGPRSLCGAVISGVVLDSQGKPIEGARIDHTGAMVVVSPTRLAIPPASGEIRSASDGRFEAVTTKPAIVIRKPGFESQRILIHGDAELKIVLKHIGSIPKCEVRIPPVQTKAINDIDYVATWTYIGTQDGPKGFISGQGPVYSFGAPSDSHVWTSVDYFEVMYDDGVVDARGHSADDNYWRSQSIFGAAAQYYGIDRATAQILDCIMGQNRLKSP